MIDSVPLPARDGPFEAGFWEALDRGVLAHQHCDRCGRWHFPPRWRCSCGGELRYRPVSGRATLWSWVVAHPPVLPAFAARTPYVVAVAGLGESPSLHMVGSVVFDGQDPGRDSADPARLRIGMPLRARITTFESGLVWPVWQVVS